MRPCASPDTFALSYLLLPGPTQVLTRSSEFAYTLQIFVLTDYLFLYIIILVTHSRHIVLLGDRWL
jgi:hypothetical protein